MADPQASVSTARVLIRRKRAILGLEFGVFPWAGTPRLASEVSRLVPEPDRAQSQLPAPAPPARLKRRRNYCQNL